MSEPQKKRVRTTNFAIAVGNALKAHAQGKPDDYMYQLLAVLLGMVKDSTRGTFLRGEMIAQRNPNIYPQIVIATGGEVLEADPRNIPPRIYTVPNIAEVQKEERAWSRGRILDFLAEWNVPGTPANQAAEFFQAYNPERNVERMINDLIAYFSNGTPMPVAEQEPEHVEEADTHPPDQLEALVNALIQEIMSRLQLHMAEMIKTTLLQMQNRVSDDFHGQAEDFFSGLRSELEGLIQRAKTLEDLDIVELINELHKRLLALSEEPDSETRDAFASKYSEELSKLLQLVDAFTRPTGKRETLLQMIRTMTNL